MQKHYDAIVLGTGGVGSAALYHLARQGVRALGIDRFPGGHDRGSSHGQTRIIRLAYFEHPDYVPLLRRAYQLWEELQALAGQSLYVETGLLEVGPPNGVVIPGVIASARQHQLAVEHLTPQDVASRFPGFKAPEGYQSLFESRAGYLRVEDCVLAHLRLAKQLGADICIGPTVKCWSVRKGVVHIETDEGNYETPRLIVTAGAWSPVLLPHLEKHFEIRRKHLHWFATRSNVYHADRGAPCFFYETPNGHFYGFAQIDDRGVKVAEHSGGTPIVDPLNDDRGIDPQDQSRVRSFLKDWLPEVSDQATGHATCFYTMSSDENFIIDRHPEYSQVVFAAGLSGHGFKFASVLGETLTELTLTNTPNPSVQFLSTNRFLRGPQLL